MISMTEWFLTSSVLILAILILRVTADKKLSLRVRYALWAVVLVRLLFPVSPLTSNLSLSAISQPIQTQAEEKMLYAIPTRTYENEFIYIEPHYSRTEHSLSVNIGGNSYEYANYLSGGSVSHQGQRTDYVFLMPAAELLSVIWKLGILVTALWMLSKNLSFSRDLKKYRTPFPAKDLPIPVYLVDEDLPSPCLFGLFEPAVYLTPEAAADETTLRHVLAHELTHYAHRDHIWSFLRCVCLALHWYNPLVWLACILSKRDGELACDEGAVNRLGEEERVNYGRTLVNMVAHRSQRPGDLLTCSTAMAEGKKPIQQRIQLLVKRPETKRTALIFAVGLIALSLFFVFSQNSDNDSSPFSNEYDRYLSYLSTDEDPVFSDPNYAAYSLPTSSRAQWQTTLSQGKENLTPNCSHSDAADQFSFSLHYGEMLLDLYEMEDGCHLYLNNSINNANAQGVEKLFASSKCLAILPSGTIQTLRDLIVPAEPVSLTQEELDFFNTGDFFDHGSGGMNIRNQLLSSFYDDPRDIDLFQLFYCGTGQADRSIEEHQTILNAIIASGAFYPETACSIVTIEEMNAVLTEHLGITLEESSKIGLDGMDYLPEYNAYYHFHGDTNYGLMPHFTSSQRSGNTIWLYYQDTFGLLGGGPCVLTLYQEGERYYFRANQPITILSTDIPTAPAGDNSHLIRAATSFRYQEGPLSSYIGPMVTDTELVKQAIQILLSDDPDSGTVPPGTVADGATITLYGDFGSAGTEFSFPITNQSMGNELLSLVRHQDQQIQEAQTLASETYHRALPLLSDAILSDPRWPTMLTQLWNYDRAQWNTWLLEQLEQLGFDPYFNEAENLWFIGTRNTSGRISISGSFLSYSNILSHTASPVGLTAPDSGNAVEIARSFSDVLALHYLDLDPRHPNAVTSARLMGANVFDLSDTALCANISLAVQPVVPNTSFWLSGAGIDYIEEGPYIGEWKFTLEYRLEQQSDGSWLCTNAATGGLSAS